MDPRERSNRTEAAVQRSVRKLEEDGGPARGKQTGEPVAQGIPRNFACFLEAGFRIGTQAKCFPTCRVPSGVLVFQPNRKSPSTGVTCEGKLQMKPETPPCFQKHIHTHKYVCLLEIRDPIQVMVSIQHISTDVHPQALPEGAGAIIHRSKEAMQCYGGAASEWHRHSWGDLFDTVQVAFLCAPGGSVPQPYELYSLLTGGVST